MADLAFHKAVLDAKLGAGDTHAAGHLGTERVQLHPLSDIWLLTLIGAGNHALSLSFRNGQSLTTPVMVLPRVMVIEGAAVESYSLDSADALVISVAVKAGTPPPQMALSLIDTPGVHLGSNPFPLIFALDAIADTTLSPLAGEIWALDVVTQPASAGSAGHLRIWQEAAKIHQIADITIGAVAQQVLLGGLQIPSGGVIDLNQTAAGALNTRLAVSGRRVA